MVQKKQIRTQLKAIREQMSQEEVIRASKQIITYLSQWSRYQEAKVIYLYYPLGNEVDLRSLAQLALEQGKCICFPKTQGEEIHFYQVESMEDFLEGPFHVMEPVSEKKIECETPLILVPGVGFDQDKNRIGYGKGYYDRYLKRFSQAITVGIGYQFQVVDQLPTEENDIKMNYIITETGIR